MTKGGKVDGSGCRGNQRGKRRKAPDRGGDEPGACRQESYRPVKGERHAEKRGEAFAASEFQPDGKDVPQKGADTRENGALDSEAAGNEDCYCALAGIAEGRRGRCPFLAGA